MHTRIKVCCIASVSEADMAVSAGADALGLLATMPDGSGLLRDDEVRAIAAHVPPPIATFLLTAETDASSISDHVRATRPTAVQIVRPIDPAESAKLAMIEPAVRRVQVIHVQGSEALDLISAYAPYVHAFLLDSGRLDVASPRYGGTGLTHDWNISAAFVKASPRPVFLAGGLNVDNVGEAIARVRPYGLDLCSSLRLDGALDAVKLQAFIKTVQAADSAILVDA